MSSSDEASQTADAEPETADEEAVAHQAVSLLCGELSDRSETTDEDEAWVNPMYWDLCLARHVSWYTIHAVASPGLLLCGRAMDAAYESVVNPPDSHPVCKVCRARVRGRVEDAGRGGQSETDYQQESVSSRGDESDEAVPVGESSR